MKDEALKLALEAMEQSLYATTAKSQFLTFEAITAIKQALEAPVQEPVAWINWSALTGVRRLGWECESELASEPLYTAPPAVQRSWAGLTDEEMRELEKQFEAERVRTSDEEYLVIYPAAYWQWQRAIEAKLKEKNT
jgi:hypothetical protein